MRLRSQAKSIAHLRTQAAEIVRGLAEGGEALVITQNGVAKAVIQGIAEYERTQETMALLKILALGERQIEEGKTRPAAEVFRRLRYPCNHCQT